MSGLALAWRANSFGGGYVRCSSSRASIVLLRSASAIVRSSSSLSHADRTTGTRPGGANPAVAPADAAEERAPQAGVLSPRVRGSTDRVVEAPIGVPTGRTRRPFMPLIT